MSFKVRLPQVGMISCGVGYRGGMNLWLNVLLWLSSMRWKGCEGLSNIVCNLDRILLSETSLRESSCATTTLLPLQISLLRFLVSATLSLLPDHTTVMMTITFQVLKDNANLPGWNRKDSSCCKGPVKVQKSTKLKCCGGTLRDLWINESPQTLNELKRGFKKSKAQFLHSDGRDW